MVNHHIYTLDSKTLASLYIFTYQCNVALPKRPSIRNRAVCSYRRLLSGTFEAQHGVRQVNGAPQGKRCAVRAW